MMCTPDSIETAYPAGAQRWGHIDECTLNEEKLQYNYQNTNIQQHITLQKNKTNSDHLFRIQPCLSVTLAEEPS